MVFREVEGGEEEQYWVRGQRCHRHLPLAGLTGGSFAATRALLVCELVLVGPKDPPDPGLWALNV